MTVISMKGYREAPRALRSKMDTIVITPKIIGDWLLPGFQRPLKVNDKVRSIAADIVRDGGVIPGVLTLGTIGGDNKRVYIIDGQHRIEAGRISDLEEMFADVRICDFENMADMGEEFVNLNSSIVRMNSDDVLRGLEGTVPALQIIRKACPFVGYDNIRRGKGSSLLSMSVALRCWTGASNENVTQAGKSALQCARDTTVEEAQKLSVFLALVRGAWGDDAEYSRLWSALNLTMMMWLWKRLVLDTERPGNKRYVALTPDQFRKCAMSASASASYLDWLVGRQIGERDRSPCYARLKAIFAERLMQDHPKKERPRLEQPAWASA